MPVEITRPGETVTVCSRRGAVVARSPSYVVEFATGVLVGGGGIPYEGSYEVTPSEDTQTLPTAMRSLARDVVVNPIPSNYGRIAYDGTAIMVW